MTLPPRAAEFVLELALAPSERDAVIGDLREEFCDYISPARGVTMARWWYCWQVARSLAPLFVRSWQRATLWRASTAVTFAAFIASTPAALLVAVRTFVLQQVPLKTTAEPSLGFAVALGALVLLATAVAVAVAAHVLNARPPSD